MTKQRLDGWAIKTVDGEFIGLDQASGGYPYVPSTIHGVHIFNNPEDAQRYRDVMSRGGTIGSKNEAAGWKVVQIVLIEV